MISLECHYQELYKASCVKVGKLANILTGTGPRDTAYALVVATALSIVTTISTLIWLGPHSINTLLAVLLVTPAFIIFIDSIIAILGKDAIQFKIYRALLFYTGWKDQGAAKVPAITINSQNMIGKKARRYLKSQNLAEDELETFHAILPNWEKSLDSLITLCKNINQYNYKLLLVK